MAEVEFVINMKKMKFLVLILFLGAVAFLEMSLNLSSPIAFGDEGLHTSIARWIGAHQDYPVWIPQIGTSIYKIGFFRSPLFNILQGSFYFLFGFNELIAKLFVPFIAILTALAVYLLVNKLYSQNVAVIASVITMSVPSFVTYSILLYSDLLVAFFISISIFSTFLAFKANRRKYLFLAGICGALSILADATGYVILAFFGLVFLYDISKKRNIVHTLKFWLPAIVIFAIIITPFFIRNEVYYKTLTCQFPNIFSTKYCTPEPNYTPKYSFEGVLSSGQQQIELFSSGIIYWLNFAYGYVYFVPLFAIVGIVFVLYRKENIDILLLISLFVFILIFYQSITGRIEDLVRNLVSSTAVVALLAALFANEIGEFMNKYKKELIWVVIFFVLAFSFFMVKDRLDTLSGVKAFSPMFFEACNWVKQNLPQNAILLSFNTAPTVYNCERQAQWNLVDGADIILSQNVTLAKERLKANGFTHIFIQKFSLTQEKIQAGYWVGFLDMLNQNSNSFKVVYENGPDLVTCVKQGGCDGTIIYEIVY